MELQFYGANCVRISTKKAQIVVDDNLADLKLSSITKAGDIVLFTSARVEPSVDVKMAIDYPGEYEVSGVSIQGISARSHMDEEGKHSAIIYLLMIDDVRLVILGHIYPELTDEQLETIGMVDVLIVPVGGSGYTLDGVGALKLIKKIEPKVVIPTHYADSKITFPVPQQDLQTAITSLAMEVKETVPKLKVKPAEFSDTTQLIVLERQ